MKMNFSKANTISLLSHLTGDNLSFSESVESISEANKYCDIICTGLGDINDESADITRHFITKWLLSGVGKKITEPDILKIVSEIDERKTKGRFYSKELVACSVVSACHFTSELLLYLLAVGKLSEREFEELNALMKTVLLNLVLDLLAITTLNDYKDIDGTFIILHVIEQSLTRNLKQYFRTLLEQNLVDEFLSDPLSMLPSLRLQVESEITTAIELADAISKN